MEETIVSYETAKLANQNGFELPCRFSYENGNLDEAYETSGQLYYDREDIIAAGINGHTCYLAPTQTQLQKWLREHGILVYIEHSNGYWKWVVENSKGYIEQKGDSNFSYEDALEIGLIEGLKLI